MNFNNDNTILDVLQLYEYAMSIGKSLDYEENCSQFLRLVLKRKNLNACWILQNHHREIQCKYSIPSMSFEMDSEIEETSNFLKSIENPIVTSVESVSKKVLPHNLTTGYLCIHPLGKQGHLFLYSKQKAVEIEEILKLTPVINKFSNTLEACKAYSTQAVILKELERRNHDLNDYAHVVSHDLKSPLRNVETMVSWIEEDLQDKLPSDSQNYLDHIRDNILKMERLISDVLLYSSIGDDINRRTDIDLNNCVKSILDYIYVPDHIKIDIQDELPIIRGDVSQVEQIFQNLINNAIKYNDKSEGHIQIRYKNLSTHHCFSIIDNGIGIDPKYHDKIFDSFKRLHNHKDSSGLGLSIVKRIIQKYGGEISVKSKVGVGSEFTFTIENITS